MPHVTIKGLEVYFDEQDSFILNHNWSLDNRGYAKTTLKIGEKSYKNALMHRMIMGFPDGLVDHINHDSLDNRRTNLRVATHRENTVNRKKDSGKVLPKGVFNQKGRYQANINYNGKIVYCGIYDDPQEAAAAYDFFALFLYGEFAYTNEREEQESQTSRSPQQILETIRIWNETHNIQPNARFKPEFIPLLRKHLSEGHAVHSFYKVVGVKQCTPYVWVQRIPEMKAIYEEFRSRKIIEDSLKNQKVELS